MDCAYSDGSWHELHVSQRVLIPRSHLVTMNSLSEQTVHSAQTTSELDPQAVSMYLPCLQELQIAQLVLATSEQESSWYFPVPQLVQAAHTLSSVSVQAVET